MSIKVLHVIKTVSISNDGRLQKWINFLNQGGYESDVFILQDDNLIGNEDGYGAHLIKSKLSFRKIFPKRKGYLFKIPEYLFRFIKFIRENKDKYNLIIFHDVQQYLNLAIYLSYRNKNIKVIWDLHELPHSIIYRSPFVKSVINRILSSLDCIIYTNLERREFIKSKFKYKERDYVILNNYPEGEFNMSPKQTLPSEVSEWLGSDRYVLWLGVANRARNFHSFFNVYKKYYLQEFKLIIIGKIDEEFSHEINALLVNGNAYNNYVPQGEIIRYIDSAYFSVVLYNALSPNNFYCEPNRLYQLINRHIPIIVGHNPTMKNIVETHSLGVVLDDDGSSEEFMYEGVKKLLEKYDIYKRSLEMSPCKDFLNIDKQFVEVIGKINKII